MRVYLLDASIYIFRAYFSLPDRWHNAQGYPLNAVYGYAGFLLELLDQLQTQNPVALAAAFDESLGTCFRNDLFADYKVSRSLPDEALAWQLQQCRGLTESLGISCYSHQRYEADDLLATLASLARDQGQAVTIISRDKDLGQILRQPEDQWWDYASASSLDAEGFHGRFGVSPTRFADYVGLVGDASDDIPGVAGIGARTAAVLLERFVDLEQLYDNLEEVGRLGLRGARRVQQQLQDGRELAFISRELARLATDVVGVEAAQEYHLIADHLEAFAEAVASLGLLHLLERRLERLQIN